MKCGMIAALARYERGMSVVAGMSTMHHERGKSIERGMSALSACYEHTIAARYERIMSTV